MNEELTDGVFLEWLSDRLVHVYGESENVDFVQRLRKMAKDKIFKEEFLKAQQKARDEHLEWLGQFEKGDLYKPKAWACKAKGQRYCEYEPFEDALLDSCVHCGHPYERK